MISRFFAKRKAAQQEERKAQEAKKLELAIFREKLLQFCIIPEEFKCPLTKSLLVNPVLAPCGHTFSRLAIETCLKEKVPQCSDHKEPQPLRQEQLVDNKGLVELVRGFKKDYDKILKVIADFSSSKSEKRAIVEGKAELFQAQAVIKVAQFVRYKKLLANKKGLTLEIQKEYDDIPEDFKCSALTLELFVHPVITKHAEIFERKPIEEWVYQHNRSPLSNQPLYLGDLQERKGEAAKDQLAVERLVAEFKNDREKFKKEADQIAEEKEDKVREKIEEYKKSKQEKVVRLEAIKKPIRLRGIKESLVTECQEIRKALTYLPWDYVNRDYVPYNNEPTLFPDDFVLTRQGGYAFSKSKAGELKGCPVSHYHVGDYNLREVSEFKAFLNSFNQEQNQLLERIHSTHFEELDGVRNEVREFKKIKIAQFNKLKECRKIIENLKIDGSCREHVEFWHGRTDHGCHGYGGIEVKVADSFLKYEQSFRVPTRVREMMLIANRVSEYPSVEMFVAALNRARSQRPSFWNNPFSVITRSWYTEELYNAENNLATHKVR